MNLDNYKEHWKNNSDTKQGHLNEEKMMEIIHNRTKSNVKTNTVGLLGIAIGSLSMIGVISNTKQQITDALVHNVCLFIVPGFWILAIVSGILYYRTNIKVAKEKNTFDYLQKLVSNLKVLNKLFYYILLPLLPLMAIPLILTIINLGHVRHESIVTIFITLGIIMSTWWILGFSILYKKILSGHDYYRLQLEVEKEFEQL